MVNTFVIKIFKAYGGRSSQNQWSNSYAVNTDVILDGAPMVTLVEEIVAAEKTAHQTAVHFMRAVVSTLAHEGRTGHPEAFRTIELTGQGTRPASGVNDDPLPLDVAVAVKMEGTTGRAGQMLYRGVLYEADVTSSGGNSFGLQGNIQVAFGPLIALVAGSATYDFQIVNRKAGTSIGARTVTNIRVSGVVIKHHDIKRRKKTAESHSGAVALLAGALPLVAGAAAFFLTKNPATFTSAQRLTAVATSTSIGDTISAIVSRLSSVAE